MPSIKLFKEGQEVMEVVQIFVYLLHYSSCFYFYYTTLQHELVTVEQSPM